MAKGREKKDKCTRHWKVKNQASIFFMYFVCWNVHIQWKITQFRSFCKMINMVNNAWRIFMETHKTVFVGGQFIRLNYRGKCFDSIQMDCEVDDELAGRFIPRNVNWGGLCFVCEHTVYMHYSWTIHILNYFNSAIFNLNNVVGTWKGNETLRSGYTM